MAIIYSYSSAPSSWHQKLMIHDNDDESISKLVKGLNQLESPCTHSLMEQPNVVGVLLEIGGQSGSMSLASTGGELRLKRRSRFGQ